MINRKVVRGCVRVLPRFRRLQPTTKRWQKTRGPNTAEGYEAVMKKYTRGEVHAQAQARVKELNERAGMAEGARRGLRRRLPGS